MKKRQEEGAGGDSSGRPKCFFLDPKGFAGSLMNSLEFAGTHRHSQEAEGPADAPARRQREEEGVEHEVLETRIFKDMPHGAFMSPWTCCTLFL